MRSLLTTSLVCCLGTAGLAGCNSGSPPAKPAPASPTVNLGAPASGATEQPTEPPSSPEEQTPMLTVQEQPCGEAPDGQEITQYVLSNSHGMKVKIINFGGIITSVEVPDRAGKFANVTMGFSSLDEYFTNGPYFGGICGRFANRIANAKFTLDDKDYELFANNGPNHLHGGKVGFMKRVWQARPINQPDHVGVELTYNSPDGEEGYPGALSTTVKYSLNESNELAIEYAATADKPTVLNLTNHAYWNLAGATSPSILEHELTLYCEEYVEIDEAAIPTGKLLPVEGTCMDFTKPLALGARIAETTNGNGGYDHCYIVRGGGQGDVVPVAKVIEPKSGRVMEISSTEPGVQLYTGNYLEGTPETGHVPKQGAFCLETQHLPDSPNRPEFPSVVLRPGETYSQTTIHKFSVAN